MFRADIRAALGDVAVPYAVGLPELADTVFAVQRVHFKRGRMNQEARADEAIVEMMLAKDVTDVLAEKALDALPEFLHAVDISLQHAPRTVLGIRRPRGERLELLLHLEVPADIAHQVLDEREGLHGLDRDGLVQGDLAQARHAHQPRGTVDFG